MNTRCNYNCNSLRNFHMPCNNMRRPCCCPYYRPQNSNSGGYQMQLIDPVSFHIPDQGTVIFNSILNSSNETISYDPILGEFTLNKPSNYLVNWNVSFDGTDIFPYVRFALEVNGKEYGPASLPVSIGELSCCSILSITDIPTKIYLKNISGDTVSYSSVNPVANIVIADIN